MKRETYSLLLPQMILIILFCAWPFVQMAFESFSLQDPFHAYHTFLVTYYHVAAFAHEGYLTRVGMMLLFSVITSTFLLIIALCYAGFVNRVMRGRRVSPSVCLFAYAVVPAVLTMVFQWLFDPTGTVMSPFGVGWRYHLSDVEVTVFLIILALWQLWSYNVIFYLMSLQGVPRAMIDSAALDGAGPLRRLFEIIFPLLLPLSIYLFVMNILYVFLHLWVMSVALLSLVTPLLPDMHIALVMAILALLPSIVVMLVMQRWFMKGVIEVGES